MSVDPTRINLEVDPRTFIIRGIARHGNTPFICPLISNIKDNLWQGGCEDGFPLPEEIVHVISLYPWEEYALHEGVRSNRQVEMYDSLDQQFDQVDEIAAYVNECLKDGPTLVHCQAGLNRSSLVAARSLMLQGMSADDAITLLREQRSPACLCNGAFEDWLRENPVTDDETDE